MQIELRGQGLPVTPEEETPSAGRDVSRSLIASARPEGMSESPNRVM